MAGGLTNVLLDLDLVFGRDWRRDPSRLRVLLSALKARDLWLDFRYYGQPGEGARKRFSSLDTFLDVSTSSPARSLALSAEKNERVGESDLLLSMNPIGVRVLLHVAEEPLERRGATLLDQLVGYTADISDELGDKVLMGPSLVVRTMDKLVYPRPRPPRHHRLWGSGHLVDMVSRRYQQHGPAGEPDDFMKMLEAEMPPGARREERSDLVIFRWVADVTDRDEIARALSKQEEWIARVLTPDLAIDYNELGDQMEELSAAQRHARLTFYVRDERLGYKAVVATGDGEVDENTLTETLSWLKAGRLPDGEPLERLRLIVPVREAAVALHPRASALGVEAVLYPASDGHLWDPYPPGPWIEPEATAEPYSPPTQ